MTGTATLEWVSAIAGFGVFVGTAALALTTYRSSRDTRVAITETRRVADAAARQADVGQRALEADARPWLAPPRDREDLRGWLVEVFGYSTGYAGVRVMLENVGQGIALLPPDGLRLLGYIGGEPLSSVGIGTADSSVIPPGRTCGFEFHTSLGTMLNHLTGPPKFVVECGEMVLEVVYRDAAAGNGAIVQLTVGRANRGELWRVVQIRYLREDDRSLIAELAPPRATRVLSESEMEKPSQ